MNRGDKTSSAVNKNPFLSFRTPRFDREILLFLHAEKATTAATQFLRTCIEFQEKKEEKGKFALSVQYNKKKGGGRCDNKFWGYVFILRFPIRSISTTNI